MSFTSDTATEAFATQYKKENKKACCKRAFVLGMCLGAKATEGKRELRLSFRESSLADSAAEILNTVFHAKATVSEEKIVGRSYHTVSFFSFGIWDFLKAVDASTKAKEAAGYTDGCCESAFLRGIFVGCGSLTDPQKSYHLELTFPNAARADSVGEILTRRFGTPGKIARGQRTSLYYKGNVTICNFIYAIGCSHAGYAIDNTYIEKHIRNAENRATNCVARNISRSIDAAREHITAIEKLQNSGKIDTLPDELRYTARLRIENESATLTELALMHEPPLTKSGLNGRLKRLLKAANEEED